MSLLRKLAKMWERATRLDTDVERGTVGKEHRRVIEVNTPRSRVVLLLMALLTVLMLL